ncbi:MAG: hypothetical protein HY556_04505 [Euryarchaeota archaeon]|nr:hypothetical protein [Euryarchaeota archaeon]
MELMKRVRIVGLVLVAAGLAVAGGGFLYGMPQATDGLASAQALYEAQGVKLSYNEAGQLVDRGTPEGAQKILALLEQDWKYPVNHKNLDPNDPLVNTRDELMYQYATITYHVLHSEVTVKLTDKDVPITYQGVTYDKPGEYKIPVGKFYAQLDRTNPIEKQLRDAWTPQALALTGILATGHANQAVGDLAAATTLGIGSVGLLFAVVGAGLLWVSLAKDPVPDAKRRAAVADAILSVK